MQMKKTVRVLAAFALALAGNIGWVAGEEMKMKDMKMGSTMIAANEIVWQPYAPGSPLMVAELWRSRSAAGDHGMLLKLPAGFEAGLHSHTLDYNAVLIQGNWVHSDEGKPGKQLAVGSYVLQPGKMNHNDVCK